MNLLSFMKHRQICPICQSNSMDLKLGISRQAYRYENDNVIFTRSMRSITRNAAHYDIEYVIDKRTNDFVIDFYVYGKKVERSVSITTLDRFKDLNKNVGKLYLNRECTNCNRYSYSSNYFDFDLKRCNVGDLNIEKEFFGLTKQVGSLFRIFRMFNYHTDNQCHISCFMSNSKLTSCIFSDYNVGQALRFILPVIKFTTENKIIDRLNKLLTFV